MPPLLESSLPAGPWGRGCGPKKLKCGSAGADIGGMFFSTPEPGSPDPRRFVALRTSLNAPVVSTEDIPSGPARAAIAMWFEDDQSCSVEVRVRSIATGRMVAYAWEGELSGAREVEMALDAGLSFAESMGFLFDDDVLSGENTIGREMVVAEWEAFEAGEPAPRAVVDSVPPVTEAEPPDAELLELTEVAADDDIGADLVDPDADLNVELASGWEPDESEEVPEVAAPAEVPSAATLSKFRGRLEELEAADARDSQPGSEEPAQVEPAKTRGSKAALGRVPLVRKRRPGVEAAEPKPERGGLLARILGAF